MLCVDKDNSRKSATFSSRDLKFIKEFYTNVAALRDWRNSIRRLVQEEIDHQGDICL